uniref:serine/threonine-protein kinase n=1 Tax=Corynebacterium casei TaxID=160386 RepID=UPI00135C5C77|nr:serine/threonine-protein kinase [Corynebacterium casei]
MSELRILKKCSVDSGGQGAVFEAEIVGTSTKIAMKELQVPDTGKIDENARKRFLREVRCQSMLTHPNIVKIIAQNHNDTPPWYVMSWAESTLQSKINDALPAKMAEEEALEAFTQILDAIEYAHSEGILHRDLKPANILFIEGVPQIADFGLSKQLQSMSTTLTMSNIGLGTFAYSAPEQFVDAGKVDGRADIFSLGKIFYEMLTGKTPFPSMDLDLLPAKYIYIIEKSTQEKPEDRYSTATQLSQELKLLVEGEDAFQKPTERAKSFVERIVSGDESGVSDLNQLLIRHSDDLHLYTQFVPFIPENVLKVYARLEPRGLHRLFFNFDKYAEGSHPFSYTDKIALFLKELFILTNDRRIQSRILSRVLILGKEHNRFFVRNVFIELVEMACDTKVGAGLVAQILKENPSYKDFVGEELRESISLPPVISDIL